MQQVLNYMPGPKDHCSRACLWLLMWCPEQWGKSGRAGRGKKERKEKTEEGGDVLICVTFPLLPLSLPPSLCLSGSGRGWCKLVWWGSQAVCQVRFCSSTISAFCMCKCSRVLGWVSGREWPEHTRGLASPAVRYKGWESERWRWLCPNVLRGDSHRNCSCNLNTFQCKKKCPRDLLHVCFLAQEIWKGCSKAAWQFLLSRERPL